MRLEPMDANPEWYDYLHFLDFRDDGTVTFKDGAGQLLYSVVHGKYRLEREYANQADILFYDLTGVDPYTDQALFHTIDPFKAHVTFEQGVFPFQNEVAWHIRDADTWPCSLFVARYIFDRDPFSFISDDQSDSVYNPLEKKASINTCYYPRNGREDMTVRELVARGIPKSAFWVYDRPE